MSGDAEGPMKSPPPCGCKTFVQIQWQTSAPMSPGRQSPTCAFMFPSVDLSAMGMDDWQIRARRARPMREVVNIGRHGRGTARLSLPDRSDPFPTCHRRRPPSSRPSPHFVLVPGRHRIGTSRWGAPCPRWYARITINPAYSPWEPARLERWQIRVSASRIQLPANPGIPASARRGERMEMGTPAGNREHFASRSTYGRSTEAANANDKSCPWSRCR